MLSLFRDDIARNYPGSANQPDTLQKNKKFFAGERRYSYDTKRLVRISLYPSKIDLVTDKFTYQYLGKSDPAIEFLKGFFMIG